MNKLINWKTLNPILSSQLSLKKTLINGQAFNWRNIDLENRIYIGILEHYIIKFQEKDDNIIYYQVYPEQKNQEKILELLYDYFQLEIDFQELINQWSKQDNYFNQVSQKFQGLRILRQNPFQCLISFIISQNNNIPRITKNLQQICEKYGSKLQNIDGDNYYKFPTLNQLTKASIEELQNIGLGYRSKYIQNCCEFLNEKGGEQWLHDLRGLTYENIKNELLQINGVGNKVADCVSLYSLDCAECVPVDTHVWQIYKKNYFNNNKKESLTKEMYSTVQNFFVKKFGNKAGWAHLYLFANNINQFKKESIKNKNTQIEDDKGNKKKIKKNEQKEEQNEIVEKKIKI